MIHPLNPASSPARRTCQHAGLNRCKWFSPMQLDFLGEGRFRQGLNAPAKILTNLFHPIRAFVCFFWGG
jgi:hypothetical protein